MYRFFTRKHVVSSSYFYTFSQEKRQCGKKALTHLESLPSVSRVILLRDACDSVNSHVMECHIMPDNPHKKAYKALSVYSRPTGYLCRSSSTWCGHDSIRRATWRTSLALDMYTELKYARETLPKNSLFVHMENDVYLNPSKFPETPVEFPFLCYIPAYNIRNEEVVYYVGSGTLCFIFRNDATLDQALECLLAKHMIQPADWIMYDCFPDMRAFDASEHLGKISTLEN